MTAHAVLVPGADRRRTKRHIDLVGPYKGHWIEWIPDPDRYRELVRRGEIDPAAAIPSRALLEHLASIVVASSITEDEDGPIDLRTVEGWMKMPASFAADVGRAIDRARGLN